MEEMCGFDTTMYGKLRRDRTRLARRMGRTRSVNAAEDRRCAGGNGGRPKRTRSVSVRGLRGNVASCAISWSKVGVDDRRKAGLPLGVVAALAAVGGDEEAADVVLELLLPEGFFSLVLPTHGTR